jgi:hypothetical protein
VALLVACSQTLVAARAVVLQRMALLAQAAPLYREREVEQVAALKTLPQPISLEQRAVSRAWRSSMQQQGLLLPIPRHHFRAMQAVALLLVSQERAVAALAHLHLRRAQAAQAASPAAAAVAAAHRLTQARPVLAVQEAAA